MNPQQLYNEVCVECAQHITRRYSTSFSLGIRLFEPALRDPIYAIYGFVRFADEIVDTFHQHDKKTLLAEFKDDHDTGQEECEGKSRQANQPADSSPRFSRQTVERASRWPC